MERRPFLKLPLYGPVGEQAESFEKMASKTADNLKKMGFFDQREHAPAHRFGLGREEGE